MSAPDGPEPLRFAHPAADALAAPATMTGSDAAPALVAGRCAACGVQQFPAGGACPACGGETIERVALPARGELWTFTVQRFEPKPPFQPNGPFEPYGVGYVDFGGVRVEGVIPAECVERLRIGAEMRTVLVPCGPPDGGRQRWVHGFVPVAAEEPADG